MEYGRNPIPGDPWLTLAGLPGLEPEPPAPEFGGESVERLVDLLVVRYVGANIMGGRMPLKSFMDDIERRLIESCLSLTLGNQRRAAAILGIKPTALFEKLKKHGLRGPAAEAGLSVSPSRPVVIPFAGHPPTGGGE